MSFLTSDTLSFGHFPNFTTGIFCKVNDILCLLVGLATVPCARGGASVSLSCVEVPPVDSTAGGSSIKPSVNDCNQSGKESLLSFAGVD